MVLWRVGMIILTLLSVLHAGLVSPVGDELKISVGIVAIIVVIILSMTKMIAEMISDPKLNAWVKTEFREFAVALIIVSLLSIVVTGVFASDKIGQILTNTASGTNYIDTSIDKIDVWLGDFDDAFKEAVKAGGKIRTASTYSPYMSIPLWYVSISYSSNPLAGSMLMLTPLTIATQALTNAIFLSEGLRLMIVYSDIIVPNILLPLAFMTRLIPFTRKLGNTLIAIAIATYVFLPLSVIIVDDLNHAAGIDLEEPDIDLDALDAASDIMIVAFPFCEVAPIRFLLGLGDYPFALIVCLFLLFIPGGQAAYPGCVTLVQNVIYPIIQIVFQIAFSLSVLIWEGIISSDAAPYWLTAFDEVVPYLKAVNSLVFLTYINLILIAIITISGARSLSSALGGESYMFGVQRLI